MASAEAIGECIRVLEHILGRDFLRELPFLFILIPPGLALRYENLTGDRKLMAFLISS